GGRKPAGGLAAHRLKQVKALGRIARKRRRHKSVQPMASTPASSETIGENAYRRIRADIIFGRIAPGQKLKLDRLKDSYGASISTLREILSRLTSEGLVYAEGQRGFEASPVSVENLREIAA